MITETISRWCLRGFSHGRYPSIRKGTRASTELYQCRHASSSGTSQHKSKQVLNYLKQCQARREWSVPGRYMLESLRTKMLTSVGFDRNLSVEKSDSRISTNSSAKSCPIQLTRSTIRNISKNPVNVWITYNNNSML